MYAVTVSGRFAAIRPRCPLFKPDALNQLPGIT